MVWPGRGMGWGEFFKAFKAEWARDNVGNVAAALTFFAVLAIFPFLIFLVSLLGVVINPQQAQALITELGKVAPAEVTKILGDRLNELASSQPYGLLTVGALGAIWSASGGMVALMEALNTVYGVEDRRSFLKKRGIAVGMTLFTALFALVAAGAAVITPVIAGKLGEPLGTIINLARFPIAGVLMMFMWAVLYYVLPDVEQKFKFITPGSVIGVVIWLVASWGFSMYVANFGSYDKNYGALGGIVVMLFWLWISSQVLLAGAEMNSVLEHKSPEGKAPGAKALGTAEGVQMTKTEAEARGARLPGNTRFRPQPPPQPPPEGKPPRLPATAAAIWAAGVGLGLALMRRGQRA